MTAERLLVVEDDPEIGEELADALRVQGYGVDWARDAAGALRSVATPPDLILLDLGLPDLDGVALTRQLRRQGVASIIVAVTARTDELDVIAALDAGADDYLTKPVRLAELLARVRAHLRRRPATETATIEAGTLRIDLIARTAHVEGAELGLRPKELDLLAVLAARSGKPVRREELMAEVWDAHWFGSTKTLDVHVATLRRKLEQAGDGAGKILTIRGYGYRYDAQGAAG